jgi:enoyl-CoA hydratase/carnithine racemase
MSDPRSSSGRGSHVVTITLNRPAKKNASTEVLRRLCGAWDMIDADDDVLAAI